MSEITYAKSIRDAIKEEMLRDSGIIFMGEDIGRYGGVFGVSEGMLEQFGEERIIETPISETAFMGCAVGAAITGLRPIVEIMFSDFIGVCYDQIINQAAKMSYMFGGKVNVPLVIRASSGGGTGAAAQHSQSFENLFAHIPGLKVVMPSTPYDAKGLLKTAIRDNNPVVFLEPKLLYKTTGDVPDKDYTIPLGKGDIKRKGEDITIITYGRTVQMALEAAKGLQAMGIEAEVVDIRTISPLDTEIIIKSVKKTHKAVVVHEGVEFGGFGGEIVSKLIDSEAFYYIDKPIKRVGALFSPVPFNPELEKHMLPDINNIAEAALSLFKGDK